VENGEAAIEALVAAAAAGAPFTIVLLDANMPGLDGFGVVERIGERPELASTTIMMLTSSGQYGDVTRCRELGISTYLTKPVCADDLHEAMGRALDGGETVRPRAPRVPDSITRARQPLEILLAEDNVVNQRVAVGLLARRGHHVVVVGNGLEALAAIAQRRFDVVLMDLQMPEMGGFDATAEIRRRERGTGAHVRIVALTAHAMNHDRDRCLAMGMDGYLSKPIEPSLLFAAVEQASPVPAPAAAQPPRSAAAIDRDAVLRRLGGDEALLADVVRLFLEDCPQRLAAIEAALERGDADDIRSAAHALKGPAGNLSATALFEAARALERAGAEGRIDDARSMWTRVATEAAAAMNTLRQFDITALEPSCAS